jgi:hypothetical protein
MTNNIEMVFIELNRLPEHVILNIERTKKMFPNQSITLLTNITNHASLERLSSKNICKIVNIDSNQSRIKLLKLSENYKNSDDLFWIFTLERIFTFLDYHEVVPNFKLLHVESDVILFPDFPWGKFSEVDTVAWGKYSKTHDVAALLYSPQLSSSRNLKEKLLEAVTLKPNLTDMTALSYVAKSNSLGVCVLPTALEEISSLMRLKQNCSEEKYSVISQEEHRFQGIFDVQAIGMWIDGIDPKHFMGISVNMPDSIFNKGESLIDLSNIKFSIEKNGQLGIRTQSGTKNVFCLHIHSKRLELFGENWVSELTTSIELINLGIQSKRFFFKILVQVLRINAQQGTLTRLLSRKLFPERFWVYGKKIKSTFRA